MKPGFLNNKDNIRCYRCFILISSFILIYPSLLFSRDYPTTLKSFKSILPGLDTIPAGNLSFFVSNRGSDSNDGRSSSTPRRNIRSIQELITKTATPGSKVLLNLDENSLFREQYNAVQNGVKVGAYGSTNPGKLAKLTGMDVIESWIQAPSKNSVYGHSLTHSIDLGDPAYTYVIIAEIDTAYEKTHPFSAIKYLRYVADIETCNNTPGSYYTPLVTSSPVMIYIHPTEGAPGKNKFRYEVSTRNNNINGYNIENATYENLYLQTSSYGTGMLAGGKNSMIKNIIFQGGGIHHTVVKSGQIDSCLFLPGPKGLRDEIAAVFYNLDGKDANNKITNTIFIDAAIPVYAHTNGQVNHKSLSLDKVYAFATNTEATYGLSANDTDSILVNNCYVDGYSYGWWFGGGAKLTIQNSIFRNTNQSAIMPFAKPDVVNGQATINNVLIKTNANDHNQNLVNGWMAFGVRSPNSNLNVEVSNTILHGFSTYKELSNAVSTFNVSGLLRAHHNIYICDVNDKNSMHLTNADNSTGKGKSTNVYSDFNAYILLRGSQFHWGVTPNSDVGPDIIKLTDWQTASGQDKNSILIDLRNNPLGLKAIFVDPDNGNWSFAPTLLADAIRKISAGMTVPPLYYPKRPTIKNDNTPFKTPSGVSLLRGTIQSESESLIQWQTFHENEFSSFVVEYSLDGSHYLEAGRIEAKNDNMDHTYEFAYTHLYSDSIFFRLKCFDTDSSNFFNSSITLKGNFSQVHRINVYPNPFLEAITVEHPRRDAGEITVYDYTGRLLKVVTVQSRSSKTRVPLSNLPSGSYFVQWKSGREKMSSSIVK